MKIKKFIAPNIAEAMKQIRKELGTDAVILNSKEIKKGGVLGLFKKNYIEVLAGLDPDPLPKKENKQVKQEKFTVNNITKKNDPEADVLREIQQLKKYVELQSKQSTNAAFPVEYELIYQQLLEQEVDSQIAKDLTERLWNQHNGKAAPKDQLLFDLKNIINHSLQDCTFDGISYDKKVIQFVGPTGVGKTTTLAKIASNLILNENKRVAFITMDTYRIAAVEQLKTYAQILHAPLKVAYTIEDFRDAIKEFHSYDFILVDTAGRNFREEKYVKDLLESMDIDVEIETFLVLSLTSKPRDILDIYDQFKHVPIKEVIFTKIDETRQYGSILNICIEKQIGIAFLTNGQDVPKDIIKVDSNKVASLIIGEMNNG